MKYIILILSLVFSINSWANKDKEIDDSTQIKEFLNSQKVHNFNYPEPKNWPYSRKYIQIGEVLPNGGCRFNDEAKSNDGKPVIKIEIAVDRENCKSLILEGTPDPDAWRAYKENQKLLQQNMKKNKLEPKGNGSQIINVKQKLAKQDLPIETNGLMASPFGI